MGADEMADRPAAMPRWRAMWALLRRIEAAASVTAADLQDERIAALEAEAGEIRRALAAEGRAAGLSPRET